MALIKCPECGKEISDQATSCPNCGYPISNEKKEEQVVEEPLVEVVDDAGIPEDEVIDIEPPSEEHQREEEPPKPKKGSAYKIGAIIGGVVVVAAIAFFAFFSASSNEKEALAEELSGMWYNYEHGVDASLEFSTTRLIFEQDVDEWVDPALIDSNTFGWEPISKDAILVGGEEHKIVFDEGGDIMTMYPALTHEADFENFLQRGYKSEILVSVCEVIVDNMQWDEAEQTWSLDTAITNQGKDSYSRLILAWRFKDDHGDVLDKKYITVTPSDGSLDPGETEKFTTTMAKKDVKDVDQLDTITVGLSGQEKVQ